MPSTPRSRSRPPDLKDRTATGAVLDFVTEHKGAVLTAQTVADSLGLDRKVTATLMSRLARQGLLVKLDRGRYSSSRNQKAAPGPRAIKEKRILLTGGEELWKNAYDRISAEIDRALGPAVTGRLGTGGPQAHRERTEMLIATLRQELGGRLALDLVQPVLESIFGSNGRAAAVRLCIPRGGAGE